MVGKFLNLINLNAIPVQLFSASVLLGIPALLWAGGLLEGFNVLLVYIAALIGIKDGRAVKFGKEMTMAQILISLSVILVLSFFMAITGVIADVILISMGLVFLAGVSGIAAGYYLTGLQLQPITLNKRR